MKHPKKLLALLLTVLLVLSLSAPAMALSRDDITITGPTGPVPFGEAFTLSVAVENLPEGVEIESYKWRVSYGGSARIEDATDSILLAPGDPAYPEASAPYWPAMRSYSCDVTFAEKDTDGNAINAFTLSSQSIRVDVSRERKMNFGELLKESAESGLGFAMMSSVMTGYFLLPLFPVTFLIGFFFAFFDGLFS